MVALIINLKRQRNNQIDPINLWKREASNQGSPIRKNCIKSKKLYFKIHLDMKKRNLKRILVNWFIHSKLISKLNIHKNQLKLLINNLTHNLKDLRIKLAKINGYYIKPVNLAKTVKYKLSKITPYRKKEMRICISKID